MMNLVVSKYGAFYLCEKITREGSWLNCLNAWMITRAKKENKFYTKCSIRRKSMHNIIENSIFNKSSTHEEIYTFLKDKDLVKTMLQKRIEGI